MKLSIRDFKLNPIRFFAWLLFIGLIAIFYIISGSHYILLLALCIFIMPICMLLSNLIVRKHIGLSVRIQPSCEKGECCECVVELINRSVMPVLRAQLEIEARNSLTGEKETLNRICFIPACGKGTVEFRFKSLHCGQIAMSASQLLLADCFGVISVDAHINAPKNTPVNLSVNAPQNASKKVSINTPPNASQKASKKVSVNAPVKAHVNVSANAPVNPSVNAVQRITVLPETCEIPAISNSLTLITADNDSYAEGMRGDDYSEVLLLRDYAEGDSLKQIHWKLSGKLDRLIVREASMPVQRSLLICMDNPTDCTPDESDAIAEITASVLRALSDAGSVFSIARPEENGCGFMEIEEAAELTKAVEWLMGCPRYDGAYLDYAEHSGSVGYTRIIWCGKCFDEEAKAFCGSSEVIPLLCSSDGDANLSPENYREGLMHLEL